MQHRIASAVPAEDLEQIVILGGTGHHKAERKSHAKTHVQLILVTLEHMLVHHVAYQDVSKRRRVILPGHLIQDRLLSQIDHEFKKVMNMQKTGRVRTGLMEHGVVPVLVRIVGKANCVSHWLSAC